MRKWLATALRALARRLDRPQAATPATPVTPGPQMRRAHEALAMFQEATRLLETAVRFDPQTRRFTLREEFFSPQDGRKDLV